MDKAKGYGDHTYTFIIKGEYDIGSAKNPPNPVSQVPEGAKPTTKAQAVSNAGTDSLRWGGKAYVAFNQLKSYALEVATFQMSTIALRTGQNELQQRAQEGYAWAMRAFSIGQSIVSGAVLGGGIGAIAGAVVGVSKEAISIVQQDKRIALQGRIEAQTLTVMRIRSGNRNV